MRHALAVLVAAVLIVGAPHAQSKPALTRDDYGPFETVSAAGGRAGLSPDGAWLAYTVSRSDRTSDLRVLRLADQAVTSVPNGAQLAYSSDGRWAAYSIGYTEAEQERMRTARQPVQNKVGLLDLATGDVASFDGMQSFSFSGDGRFLAMKRYAPAAVPAAPAAAPAVGTAPESDVPPPGTTLIVRDLARGRDTTFGNVGEFSWQDGRSARLLALTISADGMIGNGVHLFDPQTTVLRVLDSAATGYSGLTWREKSADLVVLKAKTDPRREGASYLGLAWRGLATPNERPHTLDPTAAGMVPAGLRVVSFRRPSWSTDGRTVFVGLAKWNERPVTAGRGRGAGANAGGGADAARRGAADPASAPAGAPEGGRSAGAPEVDEPASVDVWHWQDAAVMARQKLSLAQDRRRNLLSAWHLDEGQLTQLAQSFDELVAPLPGTSLAYVEDWAAYAMPRSIGRPAADLYLASLMTGTRTKIKERVNDASAQASPGGRFVLVLEGGHYSVINVATRATTNLTKPIPTSFLNLESDATSPEKPPFGVGGWTKDDAAVLLYDKLDIWLVPTDGSRATRLTDGAADQVRARLVRLDPDETIVDLSAPTYVSLFGLLSKKSGYGRLAAGGTASRLVWADKSVTGLGRARDAALFSYVSQGHDDSPDLFVAGPGLDLARQVTTTNAFQEKFAWSRSEILNYQTAKGLPLQGALYYPAGYEAGRSYPMIVYLYERLSDNVHRYVAPSDRDYYNTTVFTSRGYFVLQPDIVFRPREPGLSVVESVTPAVQHVVKTGKVDAKRVGVIGHSWGGFDAAYLATHTQGVFGAAVAGAAITNLVSNYGNHHWTSGIAETDHIETGQQRMQVPLYEDLAAYMRNSAVFNVHAMTVPLLLEVGDADGTVFWHQGVEMYNIARRAGKNVVMLVYTGEDHGLRQKKNQVDYQRRILEWFGHYLRGDRAEGWIVSGVAAIDKPPVRPQP